MERTVTCLRKCSADYADEVIFYRWGCIKIKHLVHPLVFYVAEDAIYVKRSKFSYFSKIFDSQGVKSEIKAKTDRFGAYFPHYESV